MTNYKMTNGPKKVVFYKILNATLWIAMIIMMIDLLGFIAWSTSGQRPIDGFYAGAITTSIIRAVR